MLINASFNINAQSRLTTYPSARFFDSAFILKPDDIIFIQSPGGSSNTQSRYDFVFPGNDNFLDPMMRQRMTGLNGSRSYKAKVQKIFTVEEDPRTLYVKAEDVNSKNSFYINILSAIANNEAVPEQAPMLDRQKMFISYLKGVNTISDNLSVVYINAFEPVSKDLDEFEQRRIIANAKNKCDSLKKSQLTKSGYICFGNRELGEYDFVKKGFTIKSITQQKEFNLKLDDDIESSLAHFDNIPDDLFVEMDESKAEKLINFYKKNNLPRNIYYRYAFDLENAGVEKGMGRDMFGSTRINMFVQHGTVKLITFYADKDYLVEIGKKDMVATK